MIYGVYSIKDRALDGFMQPFFCPATGVAHRAFADELNKAGTPMNQHPDDYDLYQLGSFDDQSGSLGALERPQLIARGKDVKVPLS